MKKKVLKVPFYWQKKENTCGPASLKIVFSFFGKYHDEEELEKISGTIERGTSHFGLINAVRNLGLYCLVNDNASLHSIKHFIDLGLPVIVNYTEPDSNEGHYAVVIGYDLKNLILNDPWNGKSFKIKYADFVKRWYDYHKDYLSKNWMMVIAKTNFKAEKRFKPSFLSKFFNQRYV